MESTPEPVVGHTRWLRDPIRLIVAVHTIAVVICGYFSMVGIYFNSGFSQFCWEYGEWLISLAFLALFFCPPLMPVTIFVSRTTGRTKLFGVFAECCLVVGHYYAVLPMVI